MFSIYPCPIKSGDAHKNLIFEYTFDYVLKLTPKHKFLLGRDRGPYYIKLPSTKIWILNPDDIIPQNMKIHTSPNWFNRLALLVKNDANLYDILIYDLDRESTEQYYTYKKPGTDEIKTKFIKFLMPIFIYQNVTTAHTQTYNHKFLIIAKKSITNVEDSTKNFIIIQNLYNCFTATLMITINNPAKKLDFTKVRILAVNNIYSSTFPIFMMFIGYGNDISTSDILLYSYTGEPLKRFCNETQKDIFDISVMDDFSDLDVNVLGYNPHNKNTPIPLEITSKVTRKKLSIIEQ